MQTKINCHYYSRGECIKHIGKFFGIFPYRKLCKEKYALGSCKYITPHDKPKFSPPPQIINK